MSEAISIDGGQPVKVGVLFMRLVRTLIDKGVLTEDDYEALFAEDPW